MPYITVQSSIRGEHTPVLVDTTPEGVTQISDRLDAELNFDDAKRAAVSWAASMNIEYRVPTHG
jgi:hypothetical protein